MMMYCSTCNGNSYDCTNLHMHFESFSTQPVPTNTGVLPQDLEKTGLPLDLKTYTNLFKNCSSLIKILRILALKSFMDSLLAKTFETSADISLSKVTVLLQPGAMEKIRQFKPTEEDLKTAFYQLVRSSQTYFKPSSKYFLPIVLNNGLDTCNECFRVS